MFDSLLILIPLGFMLFILRAQLLRIGITELGSENLHASKTLGLISGWAGLGGAALLAYTAFAYAGIVWGLVLVTGGMALGIIASAVFLPLLRSTNAFGYHGGEGDKSVAEFNRRYGSFVALSVAAIALYTAYIVYAFAMRLTL
jgi:hypothetical protein